jgi:hypothetical protein
MKDRDYALSADEAQQYDGGDEANRALYDDLKTRFGKVDGSAGTEYAENERTTVSHPAGFVVDVFVR